MFNIKASTSHVEFKSQVGEVVSIKYFIDFQFITLDNKIVFRIVVGFQSYVGFYVAQFRIYDEGGGEIVRVSLECSESDDVAQSREHFRQWHCYRF